MTIRLRTTKIGIRRVQTPYKNMICDSFPSEGDDFICRYPQTTRLVNYGMVLDRSKRKNVYRLKTQTATFQVKLGWK